MHCWARSYTAINSSLNDLVKVKAPTDLLERYFLRRVPGGWVMSNILQRSGPLARYFVAVSLRNIASSKVCGNCSGARAHCTGLE